MTDSSRVRVSIIGVVVAALFASLLARLWFLQVNESNTIIASIERQTLRTVRTEAPRGLIYDRAGRALVTNRISWVITADAKLRGLDRRDPTRRAVLRRLSALLQVDFRTLEARLDDTRRAPIEDAILATDVSPAVRTQIAERAEDFPNLALDALAVRSYPYGRTASQILGYIGRVNTADLQAHPDYGLNDTIGRAGIEAVYEAALRGVPATQTVLTNPAGQVIGAPQRETPARPGRDVRLTIDMRVQSAARRALAEGVAAARTERWEDLAPFGLYNKRAPAGAAVVLDTTNGNVVAMASYPDYDPKISIGGFSDDEWRALNDPRSGYPLLNRATVGQYAPGSTFKLVSGFAAVASQARGLFEPVQDSGCYVSQYDRSRQAKCNAGRAANGRIALQEAVTRSSDVYFYGVGDLLWGIWKGGDRARGDAIQRWARAFGFGARTGIAVDENVGRIPDAAWRRQYVLDQAKRGVEPYKSDPGGYISWNPGDNMNTAVGQGDVTVTPLQLANAYAAFANGGTLWQPRLADAVLANGKVTTALPPKIRGRVVLPPDVRQQMLLGFEGAVASDGGTASSAFAGFPLDRVPVFGKTGTAQVGVRVPDCVKPGAAGPPDISRCKGDTSWFVAMFGGANRDNPRYVAVAMVEEGGFGAEIAAPIVRQIIETMSGLPVTPVPTLSQGRD